MFSFWWITGAIQSVTLHVYSSSFAAGGSAIYATANDWTETGINWSTRPAINSSGLDTISAISNHTWVEYNVTAQITGDGTLKLCSCVYQYRCSLVPGSRRKWSAPIGYNHCTLEWIMKKLPTVWQLLHNHIKTSTRYLKITTVGPLTAESFICVVKVVAGATIWAPAFMFNFWTIAWLTLLHRNVKFGQNLSHSWRAPAGVIYFLLHVLWFLEPWVLLYSERCING